MADASDPAATEKALITALELLRRSVADLPLSMAKNARATEQASREPEKTSRDSAMFEEFNRSRRLEEVRDAQRRKTEDKVLADADRGPAARAGRLVAGKAAETGGDAIGMLVGKFTAVLGPLAIFGQVLQSNAAGFQVLGKAVSVLAATLAPVLLPVVVVLGAAMLELSDRLWNEIAPGLEDFYKLIINSAVPAVQAFVDAVMWVVGRIEAARDFARDPVGKTAEAVTDAVTDTFAPAIDALNDATDWLGGLVGIGDLSMRGPSPGPPGGPDVGSAGYSVGSSTGGGGDFGGGSGGDGAGRGGMKENMLLMLREMRLGMGPQAQRSGLADVGKNLQMAALNQSPFEAKVLERMDKMLTAMERAVRSDDVKPAFGRD